MATAYTPGLKVSAATLVKKKRILPLIGDVSVKKGDKVGSDQIVARTELPGAVYPKNVANMLGCTPGELNALMHKRIGDKVDENEIVAATKPFISWFKIEAKSPILGSIENISAITGQVLFRRPPRPVEKLAWIDGEVDEILENVGAVIKCEATYVQGIFGIGGETWGDLEMIVDSPNKSLDAADIHEIHKGKILVGGSLITMEAFDKARRLGVAGIICGGIHDKDLKQILGYDLGVAITGNEDLETTLVVTEGFGPIQMAAKTFDLLSRRVGEKASISGATQIRAGVIRPEIIIPYTKDDARIETDGEQKSAMLIGDPVRVIREPGFGRMGKVSGLPSELKQVESETWVRVLEVEFESGEKMMIPRANVEVIEK